MTTTSHCADLDALGLGDVLELGRVDDLAVLEVRHAAVGGHVEEDAAGEEGRHLGRVTEDRARGR